MRKGLNVNICAYIYIYINVYVCECIDTTWLKGHVKKGGNTGYLKYLIYQSNPRTKLNLQQKNKCEEWQSVVSSTVML